VRSWFHLGDSSIVGVVVVVLAGESSAHSWLLVEMAVPATPAVCSPQFILVGSIGLGCC
jgi:hypothetical protein